MNDLLSVKRVSSFSTLLRAYAKVNGGNRFDAVDGGAGMGGTSRELAALLAPGQTVYAFEPFPGNHRFFEPATPGIKLHTEALAEQAGSTTFRVPSVVSEDSVWGRRGWTGYSSVGHLVSGPPRDGGDIAVQCVRADQVIADPSRVGFVKLDLQGGELGALKGMTAILPHVRLMWVEFTLQPGLVEFLVDQGFILFDTEYFLFDSPTELALRDFDVSKRDQPLSTGRTAWFGFRRRPWLNYEGQFRKARAEMGLVQTDLACVSMRHVDEFLAAMTHL
jgi:FkbM family methyltransferase